MVAQTTTLLPLECTPKPPTSTPWRPAMFLTDGGSPMIFTSLSPAYRSWYSVRMSLEDISYFKGTLMECLIATVSAECQRWRSPITYMNALKPHGYMWNESDALAKLVGDLTLMNMIGQTVWDDVIGQVLHIVFGTWFGACS